MDNRLLNLPDVYAKSAGESTLSRELCDYEKYPASVTECDGCIYRSELEAIWGTFFKKVVYSLEYEPEENPFSGWLPDFAVKVRKTDTEVVWCEVKPLHFKTFPQAIADKILKAEGEYNNDLKIAILGLEVPVWLDALPSLGWISLRKRNGVRKWHPFSVGCVHSISYHWRDAVEFVKGRKARTMYESLVSSFTLGCEKDIFASRRINPYE